MCGADIGKVELSKMANIQYSTLKAALDGKNVAIKTVGKIARALEIEPVEIIAKEKDHNTLEHLADV